MQMDTILMNSENGKTSHPHGLLLNLTDDIHLRRSEKKKSIAFTAHGKT